MASRIYTRVLICLTVLTAILTGCSGGEHIIDRDSTGDMSSGLLAYFPLNAGYTTTFQVRTSNGNTWIDSYQVGGVGTVQNNPAVWRIKTSSGSPDTGFFRATSDALYYYATRSSSPEKLLQSPLAPGQVWERYGSSDGGGGTGGDDGGAQGSPGHFPTGGSNIMIVRGTETVSLTTGATFTATLKICTQELNGLENRYWFAPGIGLVKYVIGASGSLSTSEGQTIGELLDYWQ